MFSVIIPFKQTQTVPLTSPNCSTTLLSLFTFLAMNFNCLMDDVIVFNSGAPKATRDPSTSMDGFAKEDVDKLRASSMSTPLNSPKTSPKMLTTTLIDGERGALITDGDSIGSSDEEKTSMGREENGGVTDDSDDGVSVGIEMEVGEGDGGEGEGNTLGHWVRNNYQSPRFFFFVVGLVVACSLIVVSFILLVQSEDGNSGGVGGGAIKKMLRR